MQKPNIPREIALQTLAEEIDQAVRIGPVAHVKHQAQTNGPYGLGCLESHLLGLKEGRPYTLHDWGTYGEVKATSIIFPEAPRGLFITFKTDSPEENLLRGSKVPSIPSEAKTDDYAGDYIKIDWIFLNKDARGFGIPRRYFFAIERALQKLGYPSLHIDATHNGLSYWAREEFGLKIPEEKHSFLQEGYAHFINNSQDYLKLARLTFPNISQLNFDTFPKHIDPNKPHTIPRVFLDLLGNTHAEKGGHLHFYKKF